MLILELLMLLIVMAALIFVRAKPWIWIGVFGVALVLFTSQQGLGILSIIFWIIYIFLALITVVKPLRMQLLSRPMLSYFQRVLPPMSITEREAIEAGDVWWEGELFAGRPDWNKLHSYPAPKLSPEEQSFLDTEVEALCGMLNDWKIVQEDCDMPPEVWKFLKDNRFFGMVIDKKYGGRGFSAFAHSSVIAKISTCSLSVAVNTMVPNSLGPGELLYHYGTEDQKNYYLPRLARGEEIPCFALTGIDAGSDAGAMTDKGIVCKGEYQGKEMLGIRLSWNKRYITLAPVATVMGLAFKLYDPDSLLGNKADIGITVCLLPTNHPGVEIGRRHYPFGLAFMNGPIHGNDVFIPMDWIIGGPKMVGQGWRMLMECLSIGRGISLPALSTAGGMTSYRMTGAYARLRKQFRLPIGSFEGVEEALARIGGNTYILEACRRMTAGAVDLKIKPAVASAIAKYHTTELNRKVYSDGMDVHAGRCVQMGPRNYLAHGFLGIPVGITVEGANILTRSLIIFGQGAIRCHPYILAEMKAATAKDADGFDKVLFSHIGFTMSNFVRALTFGLSNARLAHAPVSPLNYYYRQLTRMSSALALTADMAMLVLGGSLKRKETSSARLGDVLSELYLASAVLKYHADHNSPAEDLPYVRWALEKCLANIQIALNDFFRNFSNRWLATILKRIIFPWGNSYHGPDDKLSHIIADSMMQNSVLRDRLTYLCYIGGPSDPLGRIENAFNKLLAVEPAKEKIRIAVRDKQLQPEANFSKQVDKALALNVISSEEAENLRDSEIARQDSLQVDDFAPDYFRNRHNNVEK